jgi:ABC-type glycerol-3-phosphate transport system substrate-binding protein
MSKFQIIILSIFVLFIIAGVVAFATYRGGSTDESIPEITIWGTFPAAVFEKHVNNINSQLAETFSVNYVEMRDDQFSRDFIAALARGQGPDAVLLSSETLLPHDDKLILIPYETYNQRQFIDSYIQEANIYLSPNGIKALPFTVDPLVMFWNRDTFDAAGFPIHPKFWDEFTALNQKLTVKDQNGNIRKSAIALGDFTNVAHPREILGTLLMQSGNPITVQNSEGRVESTIKTTAAANPGTAISFFVQFVDPANANYSWNRSLPNSKTAFLSGFLATYFGFASELSDIRAKNPNLNFDVALLPQIRTGGVKATYGKMYGFSIVRSTVNPAATFQVISLLTSPTFLADLSQNLYMPTVRRDIIVQGSSDPYMTRFNEAALVARTWIDADPAESTRIFKEMVDSVVSGRKNLNAAIRDAGDQYDVVLINARR